MKFATFFIKLDCNTVLLAGSLENVRNESALFGRKTPKVVTLYRWLPRHHHQHLSIVEEVGLIRSNVSRVNVDLNRISNAPCRVDHLVVKIVDPDLPIPLGAIHIDKNFG
jgi:hypothetical protein